MRIGNRFFWAKRGLLPALLAVLLLAAVTPSAALAACSVNLTVTGVNKDGSTTPSPSTATRWSRT